MQQHAFVLDIEDLSEKTDEQNADTATDAPATAEAIVWISLE
jgi:hypothetical protein